MPTLYSSHLIRFAALNLVSYGSSGFSTPHFLSEVVHRERRVVRHSFGIGERDLVDVQGQPVAPSQRSSYVDGALETKSFCPGQHLFFVGFQFGVKCRLEMGALFLEFFAALLCSLQFFHALLVPHDNVVNGFGCCLVPCEGSRDRTCR